MKQGGKNELITYCCDMCKKTIEDDDEEAIEVKYIEYKKLFSFKKEFKPVRKNMTNESQNHHYCGKCKEFLYKII